MHPTNRQTSEERGPTPTPASIALAVVLLVAATLQAGCTSPLPVGEFGRFSEAMDDLSMIATDADTELEALALDALVAESRRATVLRADRLNPAQRWSSLWLLVDARHSALELMKSYVDLLLVWASLAQERAIPSAVRVVFEGQGEVARLRAAEGELRFDANAFRRDVERLAALSLPSSAIASNSAQSLVNSVESKVDDVAGGIGRRANSERLGELMRSSQDSIAMVAALSKSIEERINQEIESMEHIILENANAARPPSFLPERLAFDETAILRIARANQLKRVSRLITEAVAYVSPSHTELEKARGGLKGDVDLSSLEQLYADVQRGPERVRGEARIPEPLLQFEQRDAPPSNEDLRKQELRSRSEEKGR